MPETFPDGTCVIGSGIGFGSAHEGGSLPRDTSEVQQLVSSEVWWGIIEINGEPVNQQFNMAFLWGRVAQEQHELKVPLRNGTLPLDAVDIIHRAR